MTQMNHQKLMKYFKQVMGEGGTSGTLANHYPKYGPPPSKEFEKNCPMILKFIIQ